MIEEIVNLHYWRNVFRNFVRTIIPIACLLTLSLNFLWAPAAGGQTDNFRIVDRLVELGGGIVRLRPNTTVFRRGNLEYAYVTLDGYRLFPVAVLASVLGQQNDSESTTIRPIIERVSRIENNLQQIAALDYLPFKLEVLAERVDDEVTIFASDPDRFPKQPVSLVTEKDARLLGQEVAEVTETRIEIVRTALIRARAERKAEYLQVQAQKAGFIALGMVVSSWLLTKVQRFLLSKMKRLLRTYPLPKWPKQARNRSETDEISRDPLDPVLNPLLSKSFSNQSTPQKLNSLTRELLRIAQAVIWLGGTVWILTLFPYSRNAGWWLLNLPGRLLVFALVVIVVKRIIDIFIDNSIRSWVDRTIFFGTASRRHIKRAPSLSIAFKTLTQVIAFGAISIVVLFEVARLPTIPLVTAAGVIGFASQNLIKDFLNGCVILWEDQYAIGDVVTINSFTGYVEFISLRVTKLRSLDGELISISNGTISTVQNLTNEWSRLNLGIDVAYGTDLDKAMSVVQDVAQSLKEDADWTDLILEPPLVLGVDGFGDNSITIRLLITTRPMRQWDVGREYRLRLKKAFDEAGITIPFPQRSLWIENSLPFNASDKSGEDDIQTNRDN